MKQQLSGVREMETKLYTSGQLNVYGIAFIQNNARLFFFSRKNEGHYKCSGSELYSSE